MRKLVIKTVAITLAIIIAIGAAFYLSLSAFNPSILGNGYFNMNNAELSLKYSEKAYEKSCDISDLATLTERSIIFEDDNRTIKYAVLFINDKGYQTLIESKSDGYHHYIVSKLCEAQYNKGDKSVAISTAFTNTLDYVAYNPIHKLILIAINSRDVETLTIIKQNLQNNQNRNELLNEHLSLIEEFLN